MRRKKICRGEGRKKYGSQKSNPLSDPFIFHNLIFASLFGPLFTFAAGWLAAGLDVRYGCVYTAGLCPAILSEWLQSYRPV
jgi:hypothetical protein